MLFQRQFRARDMEELGHHYGPRHRLGAHQLRRMACGFEGIDTLVVGVDVFRLDALCDQIVLHDGRFVGAVGFDATADQDGVGVAGAVVAQRRIQPPLQLRRGLVVRGHRTSEHDRQIGIHDFVVQAIDADGRRSSADGQDGKQKKDRHGTKSHQLEVNGKIAIIGWTRFAGRRPGAARPRPGRSRNSTARNRGCGRPSFSSWGPASIP